MITNIKKQGNEKIQNSSAKYNQNTKKNDL